MLKKTTISLAISLLSSVLISDILAFFLTITGILIKYESVSIIVLIINILIFCMLVYNRSWEEGFRDPNRVKYGRMDKFIYKGFVAGLLADIPFILVYIVLMIFVLTKQSQWPMTIMWIITYLCNLQFFTIILSLKSYPFLIAIILLPLPLVAGFSYILGYNQFSISSKIVYKKKKKQ
jgi:hypothetical protein